MAGVKGMNRMSTSPDYAERVRARIKAGGIVNLLQKHVAGLHPMTSTQIRAALGLLNKVVPDLGSVEFTGEVKHNYVALVPEVSPSTEKWVEKHAPVQH